MLSVVVNHYLMWTVIHTWEIKTYLYGLSDIYMHRLSKGVFTKGIYSKSITLTNLYQLLAHMLESERSHL